jgi:cytochrome P450 family 110
MSLPNRFNKPFFLQKLQWLIDPIGYMESAVKQYPDIFTGEIIGFGGTIVFVNHPQAIQEILTNDRNKFRATGEDNKILEPLLGNSSIIMLNGESHKRRRQLLIPPFHGERMQAYGQSICKITEQVLSQITINTPFVAHQVTQQISLEVILQTVFGLYEGERFQKIKQLLRTMLNVFSSPLSSAFLLYPILRQDLGAWSPWGNFLRQRQQIDDLLYAEISERRSSKQSEQGVDIFSLLMQARDENGDPMTDEELRDELLTLLFVGHETTATAMAWALYWSHHLPEVQKKLLQEVDSLGDPPNPMDIFRLPYLSAFCNETLRIHPVAMLTFTRVVQEPVEILEQLLEPGTRVGGCIYLLHHREDLYPNSNQFRPERFLERQYSQFEFMPFGGGARRCIGDALAMFEMKLVMATILSRNEMKLAAANEKPQRRGVTLAPANGVKMIITGRRVRQELPMAVV